jgi:uncharacterized protein YhfF
MGTATTAGSGRSVSKIETYWQAYVDSLPVETAPPPASYEVWSFGIGAEQANELGQLARSGIKTATCGLLWEYEAEGEALPQPGDHSIITDGGGNPLCIIETTNVQIKPFNEVDEQFAYEEGEGDRSLAYWRGVHWQVFAEICPAIGRQPSETMPLVCERFRVVFSK